MADVFISYAREDRPRAEQIARGLQALGLDSFWDNEIPPGQTWADYIESKLAACKVVIVLWSQNSTKSQWVREEARMGRDRGHLIPVLLDNSMPPLGFGEVQAANLSTWTGDPNHPDWVRFSSAVQTVARRDGDPAPAVAPAPAAAPPQTGWSVPPPPPSAGGWSAGPSQAAWSQPGQPAGGVEQLSPIGYIQKCFRLFIDGKGRARRAEYWWWILFTVVVSLVASVLDVVLFGFNEYTAQPNNQVFNLIVSLALLAPTVSVMSRRFHDVGLSGWLVAGVVAASFVGYFIVGMEMASGGSGILGNLIVLAVGVATIVVTVMPSKPGPNQYGPNPKGL